MALIALGNVVYLGILDISLHYVFGGQFESALLSMMNEGLLALLTLAISLLCGAMFLKLAAYFLERKIEM